MPPHQSSSPLSFARDKSGAHFRVAIVDVQKGGRIDLVVCGHGLQAAIHLVSAACWVFGMEPDDVDISAALAAVAL